jgi:hypothetical protein
VRHDLIDAFRANTDAARWPYLDHLIELHDDGRVSAEVWELIAALVREYEGEIHALKERLAS